MTRRTSATRPSRSASVGRVGVVDIGSNTVRLVVYEAPHRLPMPIFNEKSQCGLGIGLARSGRLNPAGVEAAERCILRFARLAGPMGVEHLQVVATAAVRDAADGPEFVRRLEAACGVRVHVLSGAEEARLAAVGLLNSVPRADGLLGDLGGGSLDLVSLDEGRIGSFATLPLGHLRLAEAADGDRAKAIRVLDQQLGGVPWLGDIAGRTVYAIGGSWRALAKVCIEQLNHPLHVVDNFEIGLLDALRLSDLVAGLSASTLAKLSSIDNKRLATLPHAAAALSGLLQATRAERVVFSAYGMREGQMLELISPELRGLDPLLSACEGVAERTGRFANHGQEIFDWLTPLFAAETAADKRLRLAACLLSDIGWSEHPDYRAVHAYFRVLRIPYPGLTHPDRAALALIMLFRYGGSVDDDGIAAPVRALLDDADQHRARVVGLALRLAHTLYGAAPGMLSRTTLKPADKRLVLDVSADTATLASEAGERRLNRLAKAMELKAELVT